jgi:hypothetical protein
VPTALLFLTFLIGMAPALLFIDGPLWLGVWLAILSIALASVARALRPGEAAHLTMLVRPLALVALIPVIIMLLQAAPLPYFFRINNPIWQSVAATLARPLLGSISIDTGSTLLTLCRYFAWLGVGLVACAVAIDRQRAEWILVAATLATVFMAALLLTNDLGGFNFLAEDHAALARGGALTGTDVGLILSTACADRAYERFETHRDSQRMLRNIALSLAGVMICATAVVLANCNNSLFAAAAGFVAFVCIVLVRRLGLGGWGAVTMAIVGCAIAFGIIGPRLRQSGSDVTLSFAAPSSPSKAITERMLADTTWLGSGAGTYYALVPIYRDHADVMVKLEPPTTAVEVAIEAGRPLLWLLVLTTIGMIVILLRGGLRRGRDSFYSAGGAAALVALLVAAFGNAGLFGPANQIISGAVLGLAFAQRRSRTVQPENRTIR